MLTCSGTSVAKEWLKGLSPEQICAPSGHGLEVDREKRDICGYPDGQGLAKGLWERDFLTGPSFPVGCTHKSCSAAHEAALIAAFALPAPFLAPAHFLLMDATASVGSLEKSPAS